MKDILSKDTLQDIETFQEKVDSFRTELISSITLLQKNSKNLDNLHLLSLSEDNRKKVLAGIQTCNVILYNLMPYIVM